MDNVRTIVIDGVEIMTSLSAVEIASLPRKCAELEEKLNKAKEIARENHGKCMWCEAIEEILEGSGE